MAVNTNATIVRGKFETAREMAFGDITSSFTSISDPFDASFSVLFIQNFTDVIIDFSVSFEGLTTTFSLASGGSISTDMVANMVMVSAGEGAFCKYRSNVPSSGFVQVSAVTPV